MHKRHFESFIAVDFETATAKRMACQIGIAIVEGRKVTKSVSLLIQPPGNKYDRNCVNVHHITPSMTKSAPTFDKVWETVAPLFEYYPVVMHNKSFDDDVLEKNLEYYGIECPALMPSFCTYEIFREALDVVCAAYHIPVENHHDAGADAEMCARIFLKWLDDEMPDNKAASDYVASVRKKDNTAYHERITGDVLKKDLTGADPEGLFYDRKVVITGTFPMERKQIAERLKTAGADVDTNISPRTNFVLVGEDAGWKKMERIEELNGKGADIRILHWDDFRSQL